MKKEVFSNTEYDFIIVGQGIAGTFLSYYLHKADKKILVYDKSVNNTATKIATGILNPITGRRLVRTWMIETILPYAVNAYKELEQLLNVSLITPKNIIDFHATPQMQQAFNERLPEETDYLKNVDDVDYWRGFFNFSFGIGETNNCWLIDLRLLLKTWRSYLQQHNLLIEEAFDASQVIDKNTTVIFADGVAGVNNPYFHLLPYSRNKGEALLIEVQDLPREKIYKNGLIMVPWQKDNLWWIGSSYEWNFKDELPTEKFRVQKELQLKAFLKKPYKVLEHWVSVRPTNLERRPFVGMHPTHKNIGIFNGMGTKGCSLSPYFAHEFTNFLLNKSPINPLVDVNRFSRILSK